MKGPAVAAAPGVKSVLWDDWHVVAECGQLVDHGRVVTKLFGLPIVIEQGEAPDAPCVYLESGGAAHSAVKHGYVWACLGTPAREIVDFAECADDDRWVVNAGAFGVAASGLRAVENILDMSHLCFVHAGYLGEEPDTEVKKYKVSNLPDGGVLATECKFYQPLASPVATEGFDVDYVYKIPRPYTVLLHKANPVQPTRDDMILLFVQPYSEERCVARMLLVYLKDDLTELILRQFAQLIFSQDKPILENQLPKRLPLDPHAEIPIRADAASAAYRTWLRESGVRFGAIPV
jgi:phenylpropionate dioxygenase-like ring-hydroxylating dioxygenase large terminal subunit